ncbi:oligosaccharide flippase family protein [Lacinutrix venerupis]|uniref:O-antigen/teichoic acid export membrane protein n=1 Tax=Lacinutrix venerupis TaxID=1486034 RepID=A0AAC9PVE8_9FLAO|nr:oligosaccharide flippase family protein [Lacinutrix venerupis]APX98900.1 hypothetical protein BWR22_00790 [Lacinutrix venerupis]
MKKLLNSLSKNNLIVDSFWALLGNVVFKGLSLLGGILVARLLGKNIFGEFSIIKTTFISIAFITTLGFGYTATKFVADYKKNHPKKLYAIFKFTQKTILILTSIAFVIVFIFSNKVASLILEDNALSSYIKVVSVLIILNSLNFLYVGFLSGLGLFKKMAKINSYIGVLTFLFSVGFTYFFGLIGALSALILVQLINVVANYNLINKNLEKNTIQKDKVLNRKILIYSLPIAIQETVYAVMSWLINFLIVLYVSFGELGMYTAAIQLNAIILFIPGILRNVVLSHLSKNSDDEGSHKKVLTTILTINFLATLIPSLIVFIFSDFVSTFYGSTYQGLGDLIKISIFTTVFVSISNVYVQAYMSKNMNWTMLGFRIFRDGGIILLFIFLVKQNQSGAASMIYSNLILSAVFMLIMIIFYRLKTNKINNDK